MRRFPLSPAGMALVLSSVVACVDPTSPQVARSASLDPFLAKGGTQQSVPLVITVIATPNMASDGVTEPGYAAGEYVSGLNGMYAEFDGPGNLQFSPANANTTVAPLRTLALTYGAQLTTPNGAWDPNLYMGNQHNFKIKTGNAGLPRIQDLAVGTSACYPTTIASEGGGASSAVEAMHHRAVYNDPAAPGSTYAMVSRTGNTTWTMASDGGCVGAANVAGVSSQDPVARKAPLVYRGLYVLQFALSMRLK